MRATLPATARSGRRAAARRHDARRSAAAGGGREPGPRPGPARITEMARKQSKPSRTKTSRKSPPRARRGGAVVQASPTARPLLDDTAPAPAEEPRPADVEMPPTAAQEAEQPQEKKHA